VIYRPLDAHLPTLKRRTIAATCIYKWLCSDTAGFHSLSAKSLIAVIRIRREVRYTFLLFVSIMSNHCKVRRCNFEYVQFCGQSKIFRFSRFKFGESLWSHCVRNIERKGAGTQVGRNQTWTSRIRYHLTLLTWLETDDSVRIVANFLLHCTL